MFKKVVLLLLVFVAAIFCQTPMNENALFIGTDFKTNTVEKTAVTIVIRSSNITSGKLALVFFKLAFGENFIKPDNNTFVFNGHGYNTRFQNKNCEYIKTDIDGSITNLRKNGASLLAMDCAVYN